MQLRGILGTPDKPELHVLAEAEGVFGIKGEVITFPVWNVYTSMKRVARFPIRDGGAGTD
jgi:hypothetical protein